MTTRLEVHSIFESISGEAGGFPQGSWCTFIRLFGCNLSCHWCDTPASKTGISYTEMTLEDIISRCQTKQVLITGGEPLLQQEGVVRLINWLGLSGHSIQIETNGSFTLPKVQFPVNWVMDYKCPSSTQSDRMIPCNLLSRNIRGAQERGDPVYLKWVVADMEDLHFALSTIVELQHAAFPFIGKHIISPLDADPGLLQESIQSIKRTPYLLDNIIFSVQLHKIVKMP